MSQSNIFGGWLGDGYYVIFDERSEHIDCWITSDVAIDVEEVR